MTTRQRGIQDSILSAIQRCRPKRSQLSRVIAPGNDYVRCLHAVCESLEGPAARLAAERVAAGVQAR